MEKDKLIHAVSWSVLYLIGYGILTVIGNFLFSDEILIVCSLAGGIYILINAFFIKNAYRLNSASHNILKKSVLLDS